MVRETLPPRRQCETHAAVLSNVLFEISIARFPDGRIAEVFTACHKTTSLIEAVARDAAILISLGLQHGCPLSIMRGAITRGHNGEGASLVGELLDALQEFGGPDRPAPLPDRPAPDDDPPPGPLAPGAAGEAEEFLRLARAM